MKPTNSYARRNANTYVLLAASHDKQQNLETMVYLLLIAVAAFSMWFATQQRINLPPNAVIHTSHS